MRFNRVNLENFRNIDFAELDLSASNTFFLGKNGQGKTNILEAIAYVCGLRSFRVTDSKCLVKENERSAKVFYAIDDEVDGVSEVLIELNASGKRSVEINNDPVRKVSEIIGKFPVVVLSSEDIQWLRGAPAYRRRFLDVSLASIDLHYMQALKSYHKVLNERNAALRDAQNNEALINTYDSLLSPLAYEISQKRQALVLQLNDSLQSYYLAITETQDAPEISYQPDLALGSPSDFQETLQKNRSRDAIMKSTQRGPHRDDFAFKHNTKSAKLYASEGQQRALVLSLRLAQAQFFHQKLSMKPVLLADDVLGQLDPEKYERFWSTLDNSFQIIATGTSLPLGGDWAVYNVESGNVISHNPPVHAA